MAQTATTLASVLYEEWTDKTIAKQYYVDDNPLSRIENVSATMIGKQAQVPVWGDLNSGGFTSTSTAGGFVNTATNQGTAQALFTLCQHLYPISLEVGALNQASGSNVQSVIGAKDIEIQGGIATMRNQATRQIVTNGDGKVAACASSGPSNTISLVPSPSATGYGYDAIVRNWLRPGAVVDIGDTTDTDSLATAATVTAVTENAAAPTITTTASVTAIAGTHFVYIANPNSPTAANPESNGLRNMINTSGALGGLNPATAGQEYWAAAARDTSTTTFSLDLALNLNRAVRQKAGEGHTDIWTSLKQQQNFYTLLQNQVRFPSDSGMAAGNVESPTWNGMKITAYNAILDSDMWFLTLKDFVRVTGAIKTPTWYSRMMGVNEGMVWSGAGTTSFADQLFYAFQVGLRRRNTQAGATALTA